MKIKSLFASALCLAMLASCSQDVVEPNQGGEEYKGNAYVALNIHFGDNAPASRAAGDDDQYHATGESDVATYSMYIFDANNKLESYVSNQAVKESGGRYYTAGVNCSKGNKHIYLMLNGAVPTGNLRSVAEKAGNPTTIDEFKVMNYSIIENAEGNNSAVLVKDNRLLMLGHTAEWVPVTATTQAEAEINSWDISVTRCAAKVIIVENEAGLTVKDEVNAEAGEIKWLLCNRNNVFTNCRHDWEGTYGATSSSFDHIQGLHATETTIMCGNDNITKAERANKANLYGSMQNWQYASENVNNKGTVDNPSGNVKFGNTTYALVEVVVKPKAFVKKNAEGKFTLVNGEPGNYETEAGGNETGDFYVLATKDHNTNQTVFVTRNGTQTPYYFKTREDALAFKNALFVANAEPLHYVGGKSYYRSNIATPSETVDFKKFSIQRGRAYVVTLDNLNKLGAATPGEVNVKDPDTNLLFDSWISANVKIVKWEGILSNVNLGE